MLLTWILTFSLFGSIIALAGASILLLFPDKIRETLVPSLVSYATGTLLGAAFLGMIPKALAHAQVSYVLTTVLFGIILFFLLEKIVLWHHCHEEKCEVHGTAGLLLLIGDAFHNFIDGVVIAAAFITSIPFGIATALAVIAHEVPQEIGDFGVLLESGYSKKKAFIYNLLSSLSTMPGAMIAYFYLRTSQAIIPYILALSAASFIYIAIADLIPSLHKKVGLVAGIRQIILILAGVGTIWLFRMHQ